MKKVKNKSKVIHKMPPKIINDEMLPEYELSKGVRGKCAKRYEAGSNVIILEPEIASVFKDSKTVNDLLRPLVEALHHL